MRIFGLIIGLFLSINFSFSQETKKLLNKFIYDLAEGDCKIELQKKTKELCLALDTTKDYYKSIKGIKINPYLGSWDSKTFDYVVEDNIYNIVIVRADSNCHKNEKVWHCLISQISYNSDSTIALIQYSKQIPLTDLNEFGTILYRLRNRKWTRDFVIEQLSFHNATTR